MSPAEQIFLFPGGKNGADKNTGAGPEGVRPGMLLWSASGPGVPGGGVCVAPAGVGVAVGGVCIAV